MVKTKPADTRKSSEKKSKAPSSKTTKSSSSTTKENIKPKKDNNNNNNNNNKNDDDDDDFVKDNKKKKVKASSSTEPKKKKLLKKKQQKINEDIESDPETNDIEKNVEEANYVLGKEILTFKTSSEVLNFANDLFEKTFSTKPEIEETDTKTTNVISEDDKLLSLFSIFKNCVGCKFYNSLNANSFFTELYQKFEEIIESGLLNKATAKKIGLDLFDLLDNNCGHYNNDKKFRDLNIDEDFDSICKRLMSAGN